MCFTLALTPALSSWERGNRNAVVKKTARFARIGLFHDWLAVIEIGFHCDQCIDFF